MFLLFTFTVISSILSAGLPLSIVDCLHLLGGVENGQEEEEQSDSAIHHYCLF